MQDVANLHDEVTSKGYQYTVEALQNGDTEKKQFVNSKGDTWEYEETEEMRKAVERLHQTIRELEAKAPDYGVGK